MATKSMATLGWSLDMECPKCKVDIDLSIDDDDCVYSRAIFNNKWDDLIGEEIVCKKCGHVFELGGITY